MAEPTPGLGSGALREALAKWQRKYFSAGISHEMWPKAVEHAFEAGWQAALSLSSPIEPEVRLGVHLQHCNFGEYPNACKYGDDDCPALTESWSWFGKALERARPQASSEIREALADLIKMHDERRLVSVAEANLRVDKARDALAPSRQGAAKRVEG